MGSRVRVSSRPQKQKINTCNSIRNTGVFLWLSDNNRFNIKTTFEAYLGSHEKDGGFNKKLKPITCNTGLYSGVLNLLFLFINYPYKYQNILWFLLFFLTKNYIFTLKPDYDTVFVSSVIIENNSLWT